MTALAKTSQDVEISYDWSGTYMDFVKEAALLIQNHWVEVGSHRDIIPLNPDHTRYQFLEKSGIIYVLKARDHGRLIGYFGVAIISHPRSKDVLLGVDEFIYVDPNYRAHHVGPNLIDRGIDKLDSLGCHIVAFREKTRRKGGGYLKRFGRNGKHFEPAELVSTLVLRAPNQGGAA